MKINHWGVIQDKRLSGLAEQVKEINKYELKLDLDSNLISPDYTQISDTQSTEGTDLKPWNSVTPNDIHVIHSGMPLAIYEQSKKRIHLAHAIPTYLMDLEEQKVWDSFTVSMNFIYECEYTVTLHKRHLPYWKLFTDNPEKIIYVPSGVDLEHWTPQGPTWDFKYHPTVSFMDMGRVVKSPRDFLYAMYYVYKERPDVKFNLCAIPPQQQNIWRNLISKSRLDKCMLNFVTTLLPNPEIVYRGSDLLVSHGLYGDISRVAMEALGCGCPTVIPNTINPSPYHYEEGDILDLAEQILKALSDTDSDKTKQRLNAREIAEENYDITNTVKGILPLYEKLEE